MANLNQGYRSGNAFGRLANVSYDNGIAGDDVALKPGYLLRIRDTYALVTGVEAMSVDLFFTDTVNVGITAVSSSVATDFDGTHGEALEQYGLASISAYYDLGTGTVAEADKTGNILAPDYDSGFITFKALEPYAGNLYHLCPTLPTQPKYIDTGAYGFVRRRCKDLSNSSVLLQVASVLLLWAIKLSSTVDTMRVI